MFQPHEDIKQNLLLLPVTSEGKSEKITFSNLFDDAVDLFFPKIFLLFIIILITMGSKAFFMMT